MSLILDEYVATLTPKARGRIRGLAKLMITDHGSVMLSEDGARAGDEAADVVLSASDAVFRNILSGEQNPIMAYMSGKLKVEGNVQRALKVSAILTENV
ncbi:SCP2 sterol-binding domain-containing protein [Roseovarius sp.]|uniref:SCP2 sterol-binding domain-containing protein n=1 Tax=Roseovarius sp. TaxID=1486281 RepID=UPI003A9742A5